jgi:hypothetical protein
MRSVLTLLSVSACVVFAAPAAAAPIVSGPGGVQLVRPAAKLTCPPAKLVVLVRFTHKSAHRGVRAVRVTVRGRGGGRKTLKARIGSALRRVTVRVPCDRKFTLHVEALDARKKRLARKRYRITPQAPVAAPEPGKPAGAGASVPGSPTTWTAIVDERRTGTRAGQTCIQVSGSGPERGIGLPSFCGLLSDDPFFAKTQESEDPADGGRRALVLAGAVNRDDVAAVSVASPAGSTPLTLSAGSETTPGVGLGFIAAFDAATVKVENLTLVVQLKTGATQSYPVPRAINLRKANGQRL